MNVAPLHLSLIALIAVSTIVSVVQEFYSFYYVFSFCLLIATIRKIYVSKLGLFLLITLSFFCVLQVVHSLYVGSYSRVIVHVILIFSGIIFFEYLRFMKSDNFYFGTKNIWFYAILVIFLQFLLRNSLTHYPRMSSFFVSVNEFSAVGLFLFLINKNRMKYLGVAFTFIGGSSVAITAFILTHTFKITFLVFLIIGFYGIYLVDIEFVFPILSDAWSKGQSLVILLFVEGVAPNWDQGTELSAYRRASYIMSGLREFSNLSSYFHFGTFSFREGALWTVASLNAGLGILFFVWFLSLTFHFFNHQRVYIIFLWIWAVFTPIISPLWVLLLVCSCQNELKRRATA